MRSSLFHQEVNKVLLDYHLKKNFIFEYIRDEKVVKQRKKYYELLINFLNNKDKESLDWELAALIKALKNSALPGRLYKSTLFTKLMQCVHKYEDQDDEPDYGYHDYESELGCQLPTISVDENDLDPITAIINKQKISPENNEVENLPLSSEGNPFLFPLPLWLIEDCSASTINLYDESTGIVIAKVVKNEGNWHIESQNSNIKFLVSGETQNSLKKITFNIPGGSIYFQGDFKPNCDIYVNTDREAVAIDNAEVKIKDFICSSDHIILNGKINSQNILLRAKEDIDIRANIDCKSLYSKIKFFFK